MRNKEMIEIIHIDSLNFRFKNKFSRRQAILANLIKNLTLDGSSSSFQSFTSDRRIIKSSVFFKLYFFYFVPRFFSPFCCPFFLIWFSFASPPSFSVFFWALFRLYTRLDMSLLGVFNHITDWQKINFRLGKTRRFLIKRGLDLKHLPKNHPHGGGLLV